MGNHSCWSRLEDVIGIEPGNGRQLSFQNYRDLRDSRTFAGVVGFRIAAMNRRTGDDLQRVGVLVVTDNFFEALGIGTRLGRTFDASDAAAERSPRVVVVNHEYWWAQLNANANVVGIVPAALAARRTPATDLHDE